MKKYVSGFLKIAEFIALGYIVVGYWMPINQRHYIIAIMLAGLLCTIYLIKFITTLNEQD